MRLVELEASGARRRVVARLDGGRVGGVGEEAGTHLSLEPQFQVGGGYAQTAVDRDAEQGRRAPAQLRRLGAHGADGPGRRQDERSRQHPACDGGSAHVSASGSAR